MKGFSDLVDTLQHRIFKSVVSNNLVYNTCWEDPRIDRKLLELTPSSNVVMLTSAGDNALDYLLDAPKKVHCVDTNPAQNALLALKKALFSHGDHEALWSFFGEGGESSSPIMYREHVRKQLSPKFKNYWDHNISYFTSSPLQPSFYFHGTVGKVAMLARRRLHHKGLYDDIVRLLNARSLEEQKYYFEEVEPRFWNAFQRWIISQPATMTMLGVPQPQRTMIEEEYEKGLSGYIRKALAHVFTKLKMSNNYFWRVYITGSYTRECCPNYLRSTYFHLLKRRVNRINTHSSTLTAFLRSHPGSYSHFILLDHQDWMAYQEPASLAKEWKYILQNACKGARILFRSAGKTLNFLPDFVFNHVEFQPQKTAPLHKKDRVGTYGSTHLAVVS